MATTETVIVCRDCGSEVVRHGDCLECDCRLGFVAQWDQALGGGRFLGRILEPLNNSTRPLEVAK